MCILYLSLQVKNNRVIIGLIFNTFSELNSTVAQLEQKIYGFPIERDLKSVSVSILRLWPFYRLDVKDLADGIIRDTKTDRLELSEMFYIAKVAEEQGMYYEEIIWLNRMLELTLSSDRDKEEIEQFIICKKLARAYFSVSIKILSIK